jgi:hypothetical protein
MPLLRRTPMVRRLEFCCRVGLSLLLTGLAGRVLWFASKTETGLQTLTRQWIDATVSPVLGARIPIHSRDAAEQADFWLDEVDRTRA